MSALPIQLLQQYRYNQIWSLLNLPTTVFLCARPLLANNINTISWYKNTWKFPESNYRYNKYNIELFIHVLKQQYLQYLVLNYDNLITQTVYVHTRIAIMRVVCGMVNTIIAWLAWAVFIKQRCYTYSTVLSLYNYKTSIVSVKTALLCQLNV